MLTRETAASDIDYYTAHACRHDDEDAHELVVRCGTCRGSSGGQWSCCGAVIVPDEDDQCVCDEE